MKVFNKSGIYYKPGFIVRIIMGVGPSLSNTPLNAGLEIDD